MAPFVRLWFEGGRLLLEGAGERLGLSLRDPRSRCYLAPPSAYAALRAAALREGLPLDDQIAPLLAAPLLPSASPPDPRLLDLLASVDLHGGSGFLEIPAGKIRLALASLLVASAGVPVLLLCTMESEAARWRGVLGEPEVSLSTAAVLSLERAAEALPFVGHRYGVVLIDGVERAEIHALRGALRGLVAPRRIGLLSPGSSAPAGLEEQGLGALCGGLQRVNVGGRGAGVVRLFLPLDDHEREEFEDLVRASADRREARAAWLRSWSLVVTARRKRARLRELIARHRGRRVAVLLASPPGALLPSWTDLLIDLAPGEQGPFLSAIRAGQLRLCTVEDLAPTGGMEVDVIVFLGGATSEQIRVIFPALSRRGILYDLRATGTQEDPCWRWPLWHAGDDDDQEETGDP
jgi:hypothetical protein